MTIDAIEMPLKFLNESQCSWNLRSSVFSPGQTGLGTFMLGRIDAGGLWYSEVNEIHLTGNEDILAFRAFRMLAQGGVQPLIIYRNEPNQLPPFPTIDGERVTSYDEVTWDDDESFDDDTDFYQPVIVCETVGDLLLRATSMTQRFTSGDPLLGGECFSIQHTNNNWRMYEVKTVIVNDIGDSEITFEPPLREAVLSGTTIEYDRPRCTMRLADPQALDLTLGTFRYAWPKAAFVEYPWS